MKYQDAIDCSKPFVIVQKNSQVTWIQGELLELETVADIHQKSIEYGKDLAFILPYRVIRERGYLAKGDEPILAMVAQTSLTMDISEAEKILPDAQIEITQQISPSISDAEYADMVRDFQDNEIGGGNGCQTTLSRRFSGKLSTMNPDIALTIFKRLIRTKGQYMTVCFANSDVQNPDQSQFIITATPERHLEITGNETIMIPIAGTLRKEDRETFEQRLKDFVVDPKEINELAQVLDEELKMMSEICPDGGEVRGPFLREIGAVVHTEYELVGRRSDDFIKALINSFHAPTVTGSPIESAARIIHKYEADSRRYYSGEFGIYKCPRSKTHSGDLDTAILIRGVEIFGNGTFNVQAGGGLVRDSSPESEAKESYAKANSVLAAITADKIIHEDYLTPELRESVKTALIARNKDLSPFWISTQNPYIVPENNLKGIKIIILNNEDNFAFMIRHMLEHLKAKVTVVDTKTIEEHQLEGYDLVVLGPGPGDPNNMSDIRMQKLQTIIKKLKARGTKMLGICLGHQALSVSMGLNVTRQPKPTQGIAREISILGKGRTLGFYNSFSPEYDDVAKSKTDRIHFDRDENNRIIAMKGTDQGVDFIGFQFHPKSVLSRDGFAVLYEAIMALKA